MKNLFGHIILSCAPPYASPPKKKQLAVSLLSWTTVTHHCSIVKNWVLTKLLVNTRQGKREINRMKQNTWHVESKWPSDRRAFHYHLCQHDSRCSNGRPCRYQRRNSVAASWRVQSVGSSIWKSQQLCKGRQLWQASWCLPEPRRMLRSCRRHDAKARALWLYRLLQLPKCTRNR